MIHTKMRIVALTGLLLGTLTTATFAAGIEYVVHISVDGLRADAVTALGASNAPNFFRLRCEGAFTDNARTDADFTNTLPNHTSMLTGRGVNGASGHNYTANGLPAPTTTLHTTKGSYVASVFDVAHDHGLSTGLYASKDKFIIYEQSYDAVSGAIDTTGADNGRDKIDSWVYDSDTTALVTRYLADMASAPYNYSLLHLRDPDSAGHGSTWDLTPGGAYLDAVVAVDELLGDVLGQIESDPRLDGRTAVILTSDHGGRLGTHGHSPGSDTENYTIPFYVWGAGIAAGADLYTLNLFSRADPGNTQPTYAAAGQPIRNADSGNLALDLLGLGPIPGSTVNAGQDLEVAAVPLPAALPLLSGGWLIVSWLARRPRYTPSLSRAR